MSSVGGRSSMDFERLYHFSFKVYSILPNSSLCALAIAGYKAERPPKAGIGSGGLL